MMRRLLLAAAPIALFALSACGGDSDDTPANGDNGDGTPAADTTPGEENTPQPTPTDGPMPTPTPLPDDAVVLQAVSAGQVYAPTRAEFAALPQIEITHDGTSYSGVSFATLAAEVGAREGAIVTIEGTRSDNLRFGVIRFTIEELAETTVLTANEGGHLDLASTSIPPEQWLTTVTGVSFD